MSDDLPDIYLADVEGSAIFADSVLRAGDYAVAVACNLAGETDPPTHVYVAVSLDGDEGAAVLAPIDARRLAAGLLNAADAADGLTPLYLTGEARGEA